MPQLDAITVQTLSRTLGIRMRLELCDGPEAVLKAEAGRSVPVRLVLQAWLLHYRQSLHALR